MATHIAHRTDVLVLAILELLLQGLQLSIQYADVALDVMDVLLDALDVLLSLVDLTIDDHQVLQTLLHIFLVFLESLLLLPDFPLDAGTLPLQATDGGIAIGSGFALRLGWRSILFSLLSPRLLTRCRLLSRGSRGSLLRCRIRLSLRLLLCVRRERERQCQ